jgi:hypothetical protein
MTSHRALFQPVFDALSGVIVHLGNKSLEGDQGTPWFGGSLMDWQHNGALVFLPEVRVEIADLMQRLVRASPSRRITFSTDYQSSDERREQGKVEVSKFLELHDCRALRYNSLWYVYSGDPLEL